MSIRLRTTNGRNKFRHSYFFRKITHFRLHIVSTGKLGRAGKAARGASTLPVLAWPRLRTGSALREHIVQKPGRFPCVVITMPFVISRSTVFKRASPF